MQSEERDSLIRLCEAERERCRESRNKATMASDVGGNMYHTGQIDAFDYVLNELIERSGNQ